MNVRAQGTFDVKLNPQPVYENAEGAMLGRLSIDKTFRGDLEATSKGEMLSAGTGVKGSDGYVAIERVTGRLQGRKGTFYLQHNGVMERGAATLSLTVVPDSGSDELTGLSGAMAIDITDGKHYYRFDYRFAEEP